MNSPIIQVQNLSFWYQGSKISVLEDINLEFNKGEIVCISGSSGGGKTTLALALTGHIPHTIAGNLKGEILFHGVPSSGLSITEISQLMGFVQQDPENQLVTPTVYEEIAFGPENLSISKEEIFNRVQFGLNTMDLTLLASRSTNELSGGEKQRVAVASILSMYPKVLVLDEPTSSLDVQSIQKLLLALQELNQTKKMTIIILEHKPYLFKKLIDRIIVLEQGRIIEELRKPKINFNRLEVPRKVLQDIQHIQTEKKPQNILDVQKLYITLKNREILKKVSLKLKKGLIYAIVGPNGAGKTTLLHSFLNIVPNNGTVLLNANKISKIPIHKLAKDIGLIFQNPNHQIFEKTVIDEMTFAPRNFKQSLNETLLRANQLLKDTNLDSYVKVPPFSLSFGEKRRLNICSILIYKPELLLLDEPFIGQDRENIEFLLHLLKERKLKGGTTVIISHRRELCDLVDYFYVLKNGEIITQGTPKEMIPFLNENEILDSSIDVKFNAR
ncbi:MAG: ATP-binding cassette domain-containing protein [Candidatus Heimdallarchaeota archaeon]|nr:MAG: ATP-binding cassette domain-containing protein [Candidatus Heimdallarchaeota archaeon]